MKLLNHTCPWLDPLIGALIFSLQISPKTTHNSAICEEEIRSNKSANGDQEQQCNIRRIGSCQHQDDPSTETSPEEADPLRPESFMDTAIRSAC